MSDERFEASEPDAPGAHDAPSEPRDSSNRSDPPNPADTSSPAPPREHGGRKGPDPVRYGDWEKNGRCIDF